MSLLATIQSSADLKRLKREQLPQLAQEIRDRLIECCSITGGHIGASWGSCSRLRRLRSAEDWMVASRLIIDSGGVSDMSSRA